MSHARKMRSFFSMNNSIPSPDFRRQIGENGLQLIVSDKVICRFRCFCVVYRQYVFCVAPSAFQMAVPQHRF